MNPVDIPRKVIEAEKIAIQSQISKMVNFNLKFDDVKIKMNPIRMKKKRNLSTFFC
jgi:hypothetical protein